MAQISSISNGEALSSVRTKLNTVITEINILDPTDWIDYSATSTIVGWASFTTKIIKYRVVGKQVFYIVNLRGTSNSTTASITLAQNTVTQIDALGYGLNNGGAVNALMELNAASNVAGFYSNLAGWTNTGTKAVWVQFFIDIA